MWPRGGVCLIIAKNHWIDFQIIKQDISFCTILANYNLLDTLHSKGNKLIGSCPIHKGDSPTAFHVDLKKNSYKCVTRCNLVGFHGGGNIIDFVTDIEKLGQGKSGIKKAANLILVIIDQETVALPADAPAPEPSKPKDQPENKPLGFWFDLKTGHPFFEECGLSSETVEFFGLGFTERGIKKGGSVFRSMIT